MKTIRKSFIGYSHHGLAISIAMLFLAFAFAPSPAYALGNTATGDHALFSNTTGIFNTADGYYALFSNTTGSYNTADGANALFNNTTGSYNTANGVGALFPNTSGSYNTANGVDALYNNSDGSSNTANGFTALFSNTTGDNNTANGLGALFRNTSGSYNTAEGVNALYRNTTGSSNIAVGVSAGADLTTGNNNIDIGNRGVATESGRIRIGTKGKQISSYIVGISGVTVPAGVGVIVDTNGKLGTVVSSQRFKQAIKPMDKASEAIHALQPVTFRYKNELDPEGIQQFGLVAEEVEKVNPDLVARDEEGKAYTVRYEAVNAMLLNEFLKEHCKVKELEGKVAALAASLKEQAALIQKVSDQVAKKEAGARLIASD